MTRPMRINSSTNSITRRPPSQRAIVLEISLPTRKPARRRMVNPHNIQTGLAHESKIAIDLLRSSEVISFCVRLERTVGNAFDKELFVSFKKEFRHRANSRVCHACHVERYSVIPSEVEESL